MEILNKILVVVIIVLFGYIIYLQEFDNCPECENEVVIQTNTILKDTIIYKVKTVIPDPIVINNYKTDTLYKFYNIDTAKILKDYFVTRYYNDTIKNDTNAFICLMDSITQNKITDRTYLFINRKSTNIFTNVINKEKTEVYVGSILSGSKTSFNIGGSLLLKTKKDNVYGLYYSPVTKEMGVQMYWKIRLKK